MRPRIVKHDPCTGDDLYSCGRYGNIWHNDEDEGPSPEELWETEQERRWDAERESQGE